VGNGVPELYGERFRRFSDLQKAEEGRGRRLGWIRAGTFSVGSLFFLGWDLTSGSLSQAFGAGVVLSLVVFMALVFWHRRVRERRVGYEVMARINRTAMARVSRSWAELPPSPFDTPDPHHPYAFDLDICGEASLFRLLTTVTLPPGVGTLRDWLLAPASRGEIRKRQAAIAELAPELDLRQDLEAKGRLLESPSPESIGRFLEWAESEGWLAGRAWVVAVARVLPIVTAGLFFLFMQGSLGAPWWLLSIGIALGFGSHLRNRIHPLMELASGGQERFGRYAAILGLLLESEFESVHLKDLQNAVRSSPVGAEEELRRLERNVGWADVRYSPLAHAPLQALLVWDVHMLAGLERWKSRCGRHARGWMEALGDLEALSALAALRADHPDWSFPKLAFCEEEGIEGEGDRARLQGKGVGHPLLPQDVCVRNQVDLGPPGSFLFVTGSNMSGKSTLLRAVGMNAVLAQAGGPVCAEALELTPGRVQTSMRTSDSLAEGVSQYMAELNRIRRVVDAARAGETAPVLFLLDEPLQGTNEAERRVAIQTILGHLLDAGAIGAVATHDLHLDETDRLKAAARSVHLEGAVREDDAGPLLTFDYLLKPGRATSTNALALLRAVGLGGGGGGDR
jgi:ABC-type cobalamin transport system ATPase subunit